MFQGFWSPNSCWNAVVGIGQTDVFIHPLWVVPETFLNCCAFVRKSLPRPPVSPVPTIISVASCYILIAHRVQKKKLCLVFYWYFVPYKRRKDKVRVWHSLAPFCEWKVSHWQYAFNKCLLKGGVKHLHFLLFKKVSGSFENELKLLMQCCVVCCTTYGY